MPPRLIIHAGFHKTGTSSVQKMLQQGRAALSPALRILLKTDMPDLCRAARDYAFAPGPLPLSLFAYEVARVFEVLDPADPRPVLISAEDLAGLIPGRRRRLGYPVAATLMQVLLETADEAWGQPLNGLVYYSTRDSETWMQSCYNQHLRATRITQDYETYRAWQAQAADLYAMARGIAAAVPAGRVINRPLEKMVRMPHGPLTPLFRFAGVPEALRNQVRRVGRINRSLSPAIQAELLALNRSDRPTSEVTQLKQALISAARQGRTTADPGAADAPGTAPETGPGSGAQEG